MSQAEAGGPLAGRRVLVTRASHQASALSDLVRAQGGEPVELPLIRIAPPETFAPLDEAIAHLARYRWLVITSANGASAFAGRLARVSTRLPEGLQVAAVGPATLAVLRAAGMHVDLLPGTYRGASLADALSTQLQPGERVLMARGDLADPALAARLREVGAVVDDLVAYRTLPVEEEAPEVQQALAAGEIHYVTLASSSAVNHLLRRLGGPAALVGAVVACIGPETKKAAEAFGLQVDILPPEATLPALVAALAAHAQGSSSHERSQHE